MVREGKQRGAAVFPPKLGPTNIPVAPKPKDGWQTVQHKKATHQGTKSTMVSGVVLVTHQIPQELLLTVNDGALTRHFLGILELVPGTEGLLSNNLLIRAHWSLNRDILHVTFHSPIDHNLRAMTHHAFRKFFNVSDDVATTFIECPTISSVKWAHVPCFDPDNKEISKRQLADQILHQGLFAELKVTNGPIWIELACINCLAAGMTHMHKATDHLCLFFIECNNKKNITSLLATICSRQLEGFQNPFGLTKVHHSSGSSYDSSVAG